MNRATILYVFVAMMLLAVFAGCAQPPPTGEGKVVKETVVVEKEVVKEVVVTATAPPEAPASPAPPETQPEAQQQRFSGPPRPQDTTTYVSFGPSVSEDGKATTIVFKDNFNTVLDSSTDHLVSAKVASFVFPIESNTDVQVRLHLWGVIRDRAPGTDVALIVHQPGETRVVHLPDDPDAEFERSLVTVLPAGRDYAVTLFLLTERSSTHPGTGVIAGIDEIEVALEPFGDAANPVYEFSGDPRLQSAVSSASFGPSVSPDGQVVTLVFDDLITSLDSSTQDLVSAGIASFAFPVQSSTDQQVRLRVEGFVDRAAGTRGVLIIHHPNGTSLLHLPADPTSDFVQNLGTTVSAGQDYSVTLLLLAERDAAGDTDVVLGIDEIEVVLEQ